jgi:hypothetical protein
VNDELAPFPIGAKVLLRACTVGEPGTVLQVERRKLVVRWHDLDCLTRHSPEALMLAAELTRSRTQGNTLAVPQPHRPACLAVARERESKRERD